MKEEILTASKENLLKEIEAIMNWRKHKSNPQKEKRDEPADERRNADAAHDLQTLNNHIKGLQTEHPLFKVVAIMDDFQQTQLSWDLFDYGWNESLPPGNFVSRVINTGIASLNEA